MLARTPRISIDSGADESGLVCGAVPEAGLPVAAAGFFGSRAARFAAGALFGPAAVSPPSDRERLENRGPHP